MAKNDVVLLDSLVEKASTRLGENRDASEVFELFCFEQVLKDSDLSYEELESGWTDGPDDGGIDAFFVLVDGHVAGPHALALAAKRNPMIEVVVFSVKKRASFQQEPLNALYSSLSELLDLTKLADDLSYPFRQSVLAQRELFRRVFVELADRRPELRVAVKYCTRGDTETLAGNLLTRATQIESLVVGLFSAVNVTVDFLGASQLLALARRERVYSLRLRFLETYISRDGTNYVVLASLPSYLEFVTDETGSLRRYLFESNVRDYLGRGAVNRDIETTLARTASAAQEDFWWLNNGVTVLATHATVAGKELSIENVQIVNGLQTTETIYSHFAAGGAKDDDRAVLIKIILASDEAVRARIVKATNYQANVELSALRGLDKIQRDIDQFLSDHGWFYDRRRNYYKNQGKPADRIISIPHLAAAVRALVLREPAKSQRQRSRSLSDDAIYHQVFREDWDLEVYLTSIEITRAVETVLQKRRSFHPAPIALVHYVAFVYVCSKLGHLDYSPDELKTLAGASPTPNEITSIRDDLAAASAIYPDAGKRYEGVSLRREFVEDYLRSRYPGELPASTDVATGMRVRRRPRRPLNTDRLPAPTSRLEQHVALLREAIRSKQQITTIYKGFFREMCPHVLGLRADGGVWCLFYQFGGGTQKGWIGAEVQPGWRCLNVKRLRELTVREGEWHTGDLARADIKKCVGEIEIQVEPSRGQSGELQAVDRE